MEKTDQIEIACELIAVIDGMAPMLDVYRGDAGWCISYQLDNNDPEIWMGKTLSAAASTMLCCQLARADLVSSSLKRLVARANEAMAGYADE